MRRKKKRQLSVTRLELFKKEVTTDIHTIPLKELCQRLNTDTELGMDKAEAKAKLEKNGLNTLTPPTQNTKIVEFIKLLFQGFSCLLWVGVFLCCAAVGIEYIYHGIWDVDNIILAAVLILIIFMTTLFMYYQQMKSTKIMESFATMIPQNAVVIRSGAKLIVNVKELVVGDLVQIKSGDRIPADIRLTKCHGFKVDNSSLTGEDQALFRTAESTNDSFLESGNIAFFSTNAVEGTAEGIVVMCGDQTIMGRIAGLTARLQSRSTPIAKELHRFMKFVSIWACFLGIVFGSASIAMGYPWLDSALFIIGIIVANVPEGILATVTVSLTVTAKKMASKNCLVKNLEAVETLGSTSIICSDKTGTLTQNKMSVCHLWYNDQIINADVSIEQQDAAQYIEDPDFLMLIRCATLCNRAEFKPDQIGKPAIAREVVGDASEAAILKFVELTKAHGSPSMYRYTHPKLIEIPFNSNTKFQVSIHPFNNTCLLVMKGAPERILDRCSTILMNNKTVDLSKSLRNLCDSACLALASKGERVLGFCDLLIEEKPSHGFTNDPAPNFPLEKLRFLGFISLVDPPRPQVHDAVEKCRTAGIKVIMITGDHPVTAKAIAAMVGIITKEQIDETIELNNITIEAKNDSALIMTGATLRDLSSDELDRILYCYPEIVFARTSPTQKLQIVEGLQRLGKIVAVTGDGVNDAPALKKADIGVAMGISGSEVSKQSADMILLDDNFSSIVTGIEEGRKIFDNLKKSIVYTLASNVPESTPFLMFIFFNIPLPLGVLAVLCIDVLTDMMPAISMAYEPAESDIMLRPPRNPNRDNLVTFKLYFLAYGHIGVIETLAGFFTYFMIMFEYGFMPHRLFGIRSEWDTYYINDLKDSYGQEWAYEDRKRLEYTCSTGFMIAVIVCQWGDIIACKTKHNSIVQQGFTNWILNFSVLVETLQAIFLSYAPYMNYLKFYPIKLRWWLYGMPFAVAIVLFDEYRKGCIRSNPGGYFHRETYY